MTDYIVPVLLFLAAALALGKRENAYDLLLQGGADGLKLLVTILPALVLLLTAVHMLRASGAVALLSDFFAPVFSFFGIPPETAMLVLIRPISGSAALAVGAELMAQYGVDSQIGRTAAVMLGSTETTFYTISVYFGAAGIKKTRYTLAESLSANICANFLGLGNAATPMGIQAAQRMKRGGTATDELCRLIVLNTASIQLIPANVAAVRSALGCATPFDILPAVWVTSLCSAGLGVTAAWVLGKVWRK